MPDLTFAVESMRLGSADTLITRLLVTNAVADERIVSIVLQCQVHVEPARRRYSDSEKLALQPLFGTSDRWAETVRPFLWTKSRVIVPPFAGAAAFELSLPVSDGLNFATPAYLDAIHEGDVPLAFLFSGTVLYEVDGADVLAAQIPWDREAKFRLPLEIAKQALAQSGAAAAVVALQRSLREQVERSTQSKPQKGAA